MQSKVLGHEAWLELNRLFESLDALFLNYKMQTLKNEEGDNVTKHIHNFKSLLEELIAACARVLDDEAIFSLMRSMPFSFHNLISSMQRAPNLTLQSLIIDLLQEEILMKSFNMSNSTSVLYVGKKHSNIYKNYILKI